MSADEIYRRACAVFARAIELDEPACESLLHAECAADPELDREVRSLLAAHRSGGFDAPALYSVAPEREPERIGHYRIVRVLGQGGMGVVYEAEQDQPRRTVALKMLHAGSGTPERVRRLEQEAEALGRLHHPNIAQVYDAGWFESGAGRRPYLVMELVDGVPLTQHAEVQRLPVAARMDLLAHVARGVQHAHERGVVHRDLKPANILVGEAGVPRILDFGIARLRSEELSTWLTLEGEILGTLAYMSPEQASGGPGIVDGRADVYALGVIGYELCTGRLPIDLAGRTLTDAVRRIHEVDPPLASVVNRAIHTDLGAILATALSKEPERRYPTALAMAEDLELWLAHRPVQARAPSTLYRMSRFVRRNRLLVGAALAVCLALAVGAVASALQAAEAHKQRDLAEKARTQAQAEAREAEAALGFLKEILSSVDVDRAGRDARMIDVVRDAERGLERRFADLPRIEAALRQTLGAAYSSLGSSDASESNLRQAVALLRRVEGTDSRRTLQAECELANELIETRKLDEAEQLVTSVLEHLRADPAHDELDLVRPEIVLARILIPRGRLEDAAVLLESALERRTARLGPDHADTVASAISLANLRFRQARLDDAIALLESARRAQVRRGEPATSRTLTIVNNLAAAKNALGDRAGALRLAEWLDCVVESKFGPSDFRTLTTKNLLGTLLLEGGEPECAVELLERAVSEARRSLGDDHTVTLGLIESLTGALGGLGRTAAAEDWAALELDILRQSRGPDAAQTLNAACGVANGHAQVGRLLEAENEYLDLLDRCTRAPPADRWLLPWVSNCYGAHLLAMATRLDEAESYLLQGATGLQSTLGPGDWRRVESVQNMARFYALRGDAERAAEWRRTLESPR